MRDLDGLTHSFLKLQQPNFSMSKMISGKCACGCTFALQTESAMESLNQHTQMLIQVSRLYTRYTFKIEIIMGYQRTYGVDFTISNCLSREEMYLIEAFGWFGFHDTWSGWFSASSLHLLVDRQIME